jgi:glycosyltransferase involved in cell wall biosynthesis
VDDTDLAGKFSDARSVITVSDFNRDFLRTHFPESADKVHRIYNGLDLERFPFSDAYEREPRIVAVGRLVEKKGFADLVKACAELRRTGLDFSCAIVGSGECEQDLRSLAAQLGLQQQVQFLGSRPQREVIEIVQSAAVMAAPCIVGDDGNRDGLPTVILEAMALGTPCVGTDVTGIPEALIDGHSGRCIPQHDVGALASALHAFLTEPLLRRRTARAARTHVEQFFCARRNAAAVRQHFASDIETKKEARG